MEADEHDAGMSRRDLVKKGALIGGTALWVTPLIQTIGMSEAFAQTPSGAMPPPTNPPPTTPPPTAPPPTAPPGPPGQPPLPPDGGQPPTQVLAVASQPGEPVAVLPAQTNSGTLNQLARTGGNVKNVAEVGAATVLAGVALRFTGRKKRRSNPDDDPETA